MNDTEPWHGRLFFYKSRVTKRKWENLDHPMTKSNFPFMGNHPQLVTIATVFPLNYIHYSSSEGTLHHFITGLSWLTSVEKKAGLTKHESVMKSDKLASTSYRVLLILCLKNHRSTFLGFQVLQLLTSALWAFFIPLHMSQQCSACMREWI